ncbi:lipoprotein [Staphylococcus warneri]|nr:lipoprotein [Staphylococcus warneri]
MMKLIFILCLSVFLVLAGCNSDDKVSTKSQKTETDIDSKKTGNS